MALEEICKSFAAEFAEEYAEFAEFYDSAFVPMNQAFSYIRVCSDGDAEEASAIKDCLENGLQEQKVYSK